MTVYLLDENVLRELCPGGQANVRRWFASIDADNLRISALTFLEKRRGAVGLAKKDPGRAERILAAIEAVEAEYADRIVAIDAAVVAEWARLLGAKEKNQRDRALAATARVHGFVLVTRNLADIRGCDVAALDPFISSPRIARV